jgi:hypothetical protein
MDKSVTTQKKKLTLVSIYCNGRRSQKFIECPVINGKSVISTEVLQQLQREVGADYRGVTYCLGE